MYLAVLLGFAVWSHRGTQTMQGYFLANRSLPSWVAAFSTNATGESGWLLLGLTGMGYVAGTQALWVPLGEATGVALAWLLVAKRVRRLSERHTAITVPEMLARQLGDPKHAIRLVAIAIIVIMVGAYTAAQMVATGKAFSTFMEMDYRAGVIVGGGIVVAYTLWGGFKAVAYTDLIQGVLMLAGLIILPLVAIPAAGGWAAVAAAHANGPAFIGEVSIPNLVAIVSFLAIGIPFIGVPQLTTRFMAIRAEGEIGRAATVSVVVIFLFGVGAVLTGMAGRVLFPELADPETVMPLMARELFNPIITGIFVVVVLAAIMSTVDSLLILAASAIVRDGLQGVRATPMADNAATRWGKASTVLIALAAGTFALYEAPAVFFFVLFAWSGLGATFGPVLVCTLFDRRTTWQGAVAGMLAGFFTTAIWVLYVKSHAWELYEAVPGFALGLTATIMVSRMTQPSTPAASAVPRP